MTYPPCPHCDRELPIGVFFREVGARRLHKFQLVDEEHSHRFRKDMHTGELVPVRFAITCPRCGAVAAIDTSYRGAGIALLVMGIGVLLILGWLKLTGHATAFVIFLYLVMYFGACLPVLKFVDGLTTHVKTVGLISVPDPDERATPDELRARADYDTAVQIASLGPNYQQVVEPVPLEPELADIADRIDAVHAAASQPESRHPEYERSEAQALDSANVVCAACGELNQRDFERCWNCERALPAGV